MDASHKYLQYDIAYTLFKLGRYNESIVYTEKILLIDPSNSKAIKRKALSYRRLAEHEKSSTLYEKAINIDNGDYFAVSIIAKNRCDQKFFDKCIHAIERFRSIVASINRSVVPEKEKELIRKIEKELLSLESSANISRESI